MRKLSFVLAFFLIIGCGRQHEATTKQNPALAGQTAGHGVILTWVPGVTPGVVNYSVWRGTKSGGPYVKLVGPSPILTYTDTAVTLGTTYFYVATATLGTAESGYSNEVSAVVPVNPPPPPPPPLGPAKIGDRIKVNSTANIRAVALANGYGTPLYGTEPTGALGTVIGGPVATTLGFPWVQVKFDTCIAAIPNCTGWMGGDNMTVVTTPPPPPPPPSPTMSTTCAWLADGVTWQCNTVTANIPTGQTIKTVVSSGTLTNTFTGTR